jgi:hypothetical protein
MTEQTPIPMMNNPVNDIDQIKLNVGTTNTGDYNLRNVTIPGRIKKS